MAEAHTIDHIAVDTSDGKVVMKIEAQIGGETGEVMFVMTEAETIILRERLDRAARQLAEG